jgi:hypothetical protein
MTKEVIKELKEEGEPRLLPVNIASKDMSLYTLGIYAGWFGVIRMIEEMGEQTIMKEMETTYREEM